MRDVHLFFGWPRNLKFFFMGTIPYRADDNPVVFPSATDLAPLRLLPYRSDVDDDDDDDGE